MCIVYYNHNYQHAGVLTVAAGVYALHYEMIVRGFGACPLPMLVGESETGYHMFNI